MKLLHASQKGHESVLQTVDWYASPSQPSCPAKPLRQSRDRRFIPVPHERLHEDHKLHSSQLGQSSRTHVSLSTDDPPHSSSSPYRQVLVCMRIPTPHVDEHSDHVFHTVQRGHGCPLQYSSRMFEPGQLPFSAPSGVTQILRLIWTPPPHVAEHASTDQLLHDGQG